MIRSRWLGVFLAIFVATAGTIAQGGPLPTDGNAIAGWKGSQLYDVSIMIASLRLKASVEYAVYAPGSFGASFGAAADPSAGTQYVYAYQIFNIFDPDPLQSSNRNVGNLSVGLNGHDEQPANIGIVDGFGQNPDNSSFVGAVPPYGSAKWDYLGTNVLAVGAHSDILIYTSPFSPEFDTATLQGGSALGQTQYLPSPVPEPTAALLALSLGVSMLLVAHRRRRRG